jgi:MarR family transcriptional regulator, organic hydroperoxide resistance regulator
MQSSEPAAAHAMDGLRRIVRALRLSSHAAERSLGISGAQLFVLRELAAHPGASLGELAALTLTDRSSVSVVAGRLVERGLVERATDPGDARRLRLSLTPAGETLLGRAPVPVQERLIAALREADPADLAVFNRLLDRIVAAGGLDREPPTMFFEEDTSASPDATGSPRRG